MKLHFGLALATVAVTISLFGCGGSGGSSSTVSRILVADGTRLVQMDNMSGSGWATFGSPGSGVGQFTFPAGIAVDSLGRIYVADYFNDRIVRINDITGAGWTTFGTAGSGVGQFDGVAKIAIDSLDRIYVTDQSNNRVVRIDDMSGAGWVAFGSAGAGTGQFNTAGGIAVSSTFQIYVSDAVGHRVVRFDDMTGSGWVSLGTSGSGVGQFMFPVDIAVDNSGHTLITDRDLGLIQTNGMTTTGWTTISLPSDECQGASYFGGKIYTVGQNTMQLKRFNSIAGAGLVSFGSSGTGVDQFTNPSDVLVR